MRFSWRYKQTSIKSLVIVRNGRLSCSEKPSVELVLVLFPKAVPRREELPTALLVHFPHVRFLKQRISQGLWFIWHIWLLGAFQKWALINNLVSMYMLTHLCPVISIQLIHLTDIYSLTHNHIQYISLYNNKKDKYTVNISCKLIAKYIWNKKYCTMMVIHRRWSSYLVTCQHERFQKQSVISCTQPAAGCTTWPVCSVSSLLMRYIKKNLKHI